MPLDVDALYRTHGGLVLRRCRRLLGDDAAAMDAMHDTFVELLRRQDQLDARAPAGLLYRTATFVCLHRLRSARRHPAVPDGELVARIAAVADGEAQRLSRSVLRRLFRDEPTSSAVLATLHLVDGLTLAEVAEASGLSVSGVRKRLRRLRDRLHELEAV